MLISAPTAVVGRIGHISASGHSGGCEAMFTALVYVNRNYPGLRWEEFTHPDANGGVENMKIHEIVFMHSGFPAEIGGDPLDRMWSHQAKFWEFACKNISVLPDGTVQPYNLHWDPRDGSMQAKDFMRNNITRSDDSNVPIEITGYLIVNGCYPLRHKVFWDANRYRTCHLPRLGVIVHEMGHSTLHGTAIKDYYETTERVSYSSTMPSHCRRRGSSGRGIGTHGLMGDSFGVCDDQYVSQSLDVIGGGREGRGRGPDFCTPRCCRVQRSSVFPPGCSTPGTKRGNGTAQ